MTLFTEGLDLLEEREVVYADRFIPHFFASYGCHAINKMNRNRLIYYEHGRLPDLRLQLLFCAPPGFSKSFFMRQCFDKDIGILATKLTPTTFEGTVTEAAWTGTYTRKNGGSIKTEGLAEEYKDGIIAIEEFSAITQAMKQQHSTTFEAQLNRCLFGGDMSKRLASGPPIKYHTDVTVIAGTQITRFEIGAGLFRRFSYIFWIPSMHEMNTLVDAWRAGTNIPLNKEALYSYRQGVIDWQDSLNNIQSIEFADDVYNIMEGYPHFEQIIFRKIALGYNLFASRKIRSSFKVTVDQTLEVIINEAKQWRQDILADPEGSQVIAVILDYQEKDKRGILRHVLQRILLKYSMNTETSSMTISRLVGNRIIYYEKGRLKIRN